MSRRDAGLPSQILIRQCNKPVQAACSARSGVNNLFMLRAPNGNATDFLLICKKKEKQHKAVSVVVQWGFLIQEIRSALLMCRTNSPQCI